MVEPVSSAEPCPPEIVAAALEDYYARKGFMTPTQAGKLLTHVRAKSKNGGVCPNCGSEKLLAGQLFAPRAVRILRNGREFRKLLKSKGAMPLAQVACEQCGEVRLFLARAAGLC